MVFLRGWGILHESPWPNKNTHLPMLDQCAATSTPEHIRCAPRWGSRAPTCPATAPKTVLFHSLTAAMALVHLSSFGYEKGNAEADQQLATHQVPLAQLELICRLAKAGG